MSVITITEQTVRTVVVRGASPWVVAATYSGKDVRLRVGTVRIRRSIEPGQPDEVQVGFECLTARGQKDGSWSWDPRVSDWRTIERTGTDPEVLELLDAWAPESLVVQYHAAMDA